VNIQDPILGIQFQSGGWLRKCSLRPSSRCTGSLLDTDDHLTDYSKHLQTVTQIETILRALAAQEIWLAKGGNGVEARCQKPDL
jgi:hypothetical protein